MKKIIAVLLALVMLLSLSACGEKGEDVTGMYICVGEAMGTNPYSPPFGETWIELEKGGKGTYYADVAFELEWKVDGEVFEGTYSFWEMDEKMTGTIKDGVIEVVSGDKRSRFVKEGAEAPADTAPAGSGETVVPEGIVGYYPVSSAVFDGEEWDIVDLRVFEMADGVFVQFNEDGTGLLCFEIGKEIPTTYDEEAGIITAVDGTEFPFTVDGETVTVTFEDGASIMRFTRDLTASSAGGSSNLDNAEVGENFSDAFAGEGTGDDQSWYDFVSTTTSLEIGSTWYGIMEFSDFIGIDSDDYSVDVVAEIDETNQGYAFFQLYTGNDFNADNIVISYYIDLYDDFFRADTERGDCWVFEKEIGAEDVPYFSPSLIKGSLEMVYDYYLPDEGTGCTVHIFLREQGAEWDEVHDPLPQGYDEYKASLNG